MARSPVGVSVLCLLCMCAALVSCAPPPPALYVGGRIVDVARDGFGEVTDAGDYVLCDALLPRGNSSFAAGDVVTGADFQKHVAVISRKFLLRPLSIELYPLMETCRITDGKTMPIFLPDDMYEVVLPRGSRRNAEQHPGVGVDEDAVRSMDMYGVTLHRNENDAGPQSSLSVAINGGPNYNHGEDTKPRAYNATDPPAFVWFMGQSIPIDPAGCIRSCGFVYDAFTVRRGFLPLISGSPIVTRSGALHSVVTTSRDGRVYALSTPSKGTNCVQANRQHALPVLVLVGAAAAFLAAQIGLLVQATNAEDRIRQMATTPQPPAQIGALAQAQPQNAAPVQPQAQAQGAAAENECPAPVAGAELCAFMAAAPEEEADGLLPASTPLFGGNLPCLPRGPLRPMQRHYQPPANEPPPLSSAFILLAHARGAPAQFQCGQVVFGREPPSGRQRVFSSQLDPTVPFTTTMTTPQGNRHVYAAMHGDLRTAFLAPFRVRHSIPTTEHDVNMVLADTTSGVRVNPGTGDMAYQRAFHLYIVPVPSRFRYRLPASSPARGLGFFLDRVLVHVITHLSFDGVSFLYPDTMLSPMPQLTGPAVRIAPGIMLLGTQVAFYPLPSTARYNIRGRLFIPSPVHVHTIDGTNYTALVPASTDGVDPFRSAIIIGELIFTETNEMPVGIVTMGILPSSEYPLTEITLTTSVAEGSDHHTARRPISFTPTNTTPARLQEAAAAAAAAAAAHSGTASTSTQGQEQIPDPEQDQSQDQGGQDDKGGSRKRPWPGSDGRGDPPCGGGSGSKQARVRRRRG